MRNAEWRMWNKKIGMRDWGLGFNRIPNAESRTPKFRISDFGFRIFTIFIFLCIFALGCATTQDMQLTQRELQDQRNKITAAQREITEAKEVLQGVQKSQADLDTKTDRLRTELQNLQGKIDETKFYSEKASNDTLSMREELVAKLKEQDDRIEAIQKDLDTLKPPTPPPPPVLSPPQPESTPSTTPFSFEGDSAEELYNTAYSKLKAGNLEEARSEFKKFLELHPNNELADNAQFWLGESYYREQKYEEAVLEFEEVIKKYPKGNKVPDAMLKEGLAFYELKKEKEAKYILKKLTEKYPKSDQAKIAKSKLEKM